MAISSQILPKWDDENSSPAFAYIQRMESPAFSLRVITIKLYNLECSFNLCDELKLGKNSEMKLVLLLFRIIVLLPATLGRACRRIYETF